MHFSFYLDTPQNWDALKAHPLGRGACLTLYKHTSPLLGLLSRLVVFMARLGLINFEKY